MYCAYYELRETLTQLLYNNYLYLNQQAKARNFEDYIAATAFDDEVQKVLFSHLRMLSFIKPVYERYIKLRNAYLKKLLKVNTNWTMR